MPIFEINELKKWFLLEKRQFPWRTNITPYSVWVSEVMLQQTRAEVVVPFFLNWMQRYPTLEILAASPLEEVIKQWEGLGYYSRARNLHNGAKQILHDYGGIFPQTESNLLKIKGLGPYTVNAILSFAFHKKAFPLDGNAIRVLTRLFSYEQDVSRPLTIKNLRELGNKILPDHEPWIIAEAIIELGATICTKKPTCTLCPLKENCSAYKQGTPLRYPYKSKKTAITQLKRAVGVFFFNGKILLKKCKSGLMADLHEFPYIEVEEQISQQDFKEKMEELLSLKITTILPLPKQKQSFTRFRADLFPFYCLASPLQPIEEYQWLSQEQVNGAALSSGHRRILSNLWLAS